MPGFANKKQEMYKKYCKLVKIWYNIKMIFTKMEETDMKIYVCGVCGYAYEEENGDVAQGIDEGTTFEALPDSWVCPLCGVGKEDFQEA